MRGKPESMCMHYTMCIHVYTHVYTPCVYTTHVQVHTLDIHPRAPAVLRDLESNPVPGTHKPSAELVQ